MMKKREKKGYFSMNVLRWKNSFYLDYMEAIEIKSTILNWIQMK